LNKEYISVPINTTYPIPENGLNWAKRSGVRRVETYKINSPILDVTIPSVKNLVSDYAIV